MSHLVKRRFEWLDCIARDASLPPGAFRLAYLISGYINRETGDAWPGLEHLAKILKLNEKSIRRMVEELISAGYLIKRRGGDGRPNRYRMQFPDRTEMSDQNNIRSDIIAQSEGNSVDIIVQSEPASEHQTGHFCPADRTFLSQQTGHICPPIPLRELSEEPLEVKYISPTTPAVPPRKLRVEADGAFERFYDAYPRKASKGQARKAWTKAIKLADPAALIAAAKRYAGERHSEDPRFTKLPSTWLSAEAWLDEPAPKPQPSQASPTFGSRNTAKERTAAAVQHMLDNDFGDFQ